MPVYEYRCTDCEHELEVSQSFHDDPLTECPNCGGTLKKRFGVPGITFKGSGFYKTDSRGGSSASSSTSSGTSTSSSSGSSSGADSSSSTGDSASTASSSDSGSSGSSTAADSGSSSKSAATA